MTNPFETIQDLYQLNNELFKAAEAASVVREKLCDAGIRIPSDKSPTENTLHLHPQVLRKHRKSLDTSCKHSGHASRLLLDICEILPKFTKNIEAVLLSRIVMRARLLNVSQIRYTCRVCHEFHLSPEMICNFIDIVHDLI